MNRGEPAGMNPDRLDVANAVCDLCAAWNAVQRARPCPEGAEDAGCSLYDTRWQVALHKLAGARERAEAMLAGLEAEREGLVEQIQAIQASEQKIEDIRSTALRGLWISRSRANDRIDRINGMTAILKAEMERTKAP